MTEVAIPTQCGKGCKGCPSPGFRPRIGVRGVLSIAGIAMALRRPHKSNCLECQVQRPATCVVDSRQGVRCLSMEFRIINSLRIQGVRASFLGFPCLNRRW